MTRSYKPAAILAALLTLAGALTAAAPTYATAYQPASNLTGKVQSAALKAPNLQPMLVSGPSAALAGCPTGDGSVSWGKGKMCPDAITQGRIHLQDALTDGYCVRVKYYSDDRNQWIYDGPNACTTGQWITYGTGSVSIYCGPNARLYRGDGAYFTMPNTAC